LIAWPVALSRGSDFYLESSLIDRCRAWRWLKPGGVMKNYSTRPNEIFRAILIAWIAILMQKVDRTI
jgi:hypothetical protein